MIHTSATHVALFFFFYALTTALSPASYTTQSQRNHGTQIYFLNANKLSKFKDLEPEFSD